MKNSCVKGLWKQLLKININSLSTFPIFWNKDFFDLVLYHYKGERVKKKKNAIKSQHYKGERIEKNILNNPYITP